MNGIAVNCEPPDCSLHFHMDTSDYARLGVYSTASAPGIIVAHGTVIHIFTPRLRMRRGGLSNRFCLSVCLSVGQSSKNIEIRPLRTVYGFKEHWNKGKTYLLPFLGAGFVHMTLSREC